MNNFIVLNPSVFLNHLSLIFSGRWLVWAILQNLR